MTTEYLAYLYAESPVHAGASESLGVLDDPIQRESSTTYPVVWGQSLKGALRQTAREASDSEASGWEREDVIKIFGSEVSAGGDGATTPGLLSVGDAQLVALPVPTLTRTFAWATCPIILGRLARKYRALGRGSIPGLPDQPSDAAAAAGHWDGKQALGPLVVPVSTEGAPADAVRTWAASVGGGVFGDDPVFAPFRKKFSDDLLLVKTEVMGALGTECTEVSTRVQLKQNKTVENGPFQAEYLPAETILAASLTLREPFEKDAEKRRGLHRRHQERLRDLLDGALLRIGGDETLGKGLMWCRLHQAEER